MSGYKGYKPEDNQKRKANNTNDNHFDSDTNTNTKAWTTNGSALSDHLFNKRVAEHKAKAKVKVFTKEEIKAYEEKLKKEGKL